MEKPVLLQMKGISKRFPGVVALDGVSLEVRHGEVHALLGENGAGKSTLIKILGGIHKADEGEIYINGEVADLAGIKKSQSYGISVVHQELCLAPNLSVAENIFCGCVPLAPYGLVDYGSMNRMAHSICRECGLEIDPATNLSSLTIAQQQMVEIAKAVSKESNLVILDEPTGPLTNQEIDKLFDMVRSLRAKGVSFIYISHRMEEIFSLADRATILRDGTYITTRDVADFDYHQLITCMIGREMDEMYAPPNAEIGESVLEVRGVTIGKRVKNVSFQVKKGEVLGFYGLIGSGRTELMRGICGIDAVDEGEVLLEGIKTRIRQPQDAIDNGVSLVPENRKEQGLVLYNSVAFNITMGIWKRIIRGIRVDRTRERQVIEDYVEKLSIKTPGTDTWVSTLSGGNQQKVVVAKALATNPKVLILDEPTRGIDVRAKKEIYDIMNALVHQGVAIIMISSELPELIHMSNRVLVMHEGNLAGELTGSEITEESVIIYATGGEMSVDRQ